MDLRLLLTIVAVALALWVLSWVVMILFARRLPPGMLRDAAEFLPACVTTARRLRKHDAVPRRAKVALLIAILWVVSPIDLLPDFLPLLGIADDAVVATWVVGRLLLEAAEFLRWERDGVRGPGRGGRGPVVTGQVVHD